MISKSKHAFYAGKGTSQIGNTERKERKMKNLKQIFQEEKKHEETPTKRDIIQGENHGQTVQYIRYKLSIYTDNKTVSRSR